MFFKHLAVPDYLRVDQLPPTKEFSLQIVGDLSARSKDQGYDMFAHGFWHDTSRYLLMTRSTKTLAWLGFGRHSNSGVVIVRQIQGRKKYSNLPARWPEIMLQAFIAALDRSQIHSVYVQPARMSTWWTNTSVEDIHALRGRLMTYYDRIPARLGFELADLEYQRLYKQSVPEAAHGSHPTMPYHKLKLGRE